MITEAVLSLGSNIGDRMSFLIKATESIKCQIGIISNVSSVYETEPWGVNNQNFYLNQLLTVKTELSPFKLLSVIQSIEINLGRERRYKYAPRTIDIDILYFGLLVINSEILKIPHPYLEKRRFILVPLTEILPQMIHPLLKKSNLCLLEELVDDTKIKKVETININL